MHRTTLAIALAVVIDGSLPAGAQCIEATGGFGASGLAGGTVTDPATAAAQITFDDGSGPALYVGGRFETAGDLVTACIARWDGVGWSSIGELEYSSIESPEIEDFAVYDDGESAELIAGGRFTSIDGVVAHNIARWNGSTWSALVPGLTYAVSDLIAFDDGSGAKLYAACPSSSAGSGFASRLAVWDGASWSDMSPGTYSEISALEVFDDGSGPHLYAGGAWLDVGPGPLRALARWTGSSWVDVGGGVQTGGFEGRVHALSSLDDGSGAALYVGGSFTSAGGNLPASNMAKWDGANWSALGAGTDNTVFALGAFDDGSGLALYAGGQFTMAGGGSVNSIARWSGGAWSALGNPNGVTIPFSGSAKVFSLHAHDDGSGPALFTGGRFQLAGAARAENIARWRAGSWSALGNQQGFDFSAKAFAAFDSGSGTEVYAAGSFDHAGSTPTDPLVKWNGSAWSTVAISGHVWDFLVFDDGGGEELYAGGSFSSIGSTSAQSIASWDGVQWSPLGVGPPLGQTITALASYDDGAGPALWAAGKFTTIGGAPSKRIARWDGSAWSSPAIGPSHEVAALAVHDDGMGGGEQLYAGGVFIQVGSQYVFGIARWDGATWSAVGNGFSASVSDLEVFDDGGGAGPQLYACGGFTSAPPASALRIARWDGVAWNSVGPGLDDGASALEIFDDGTGDALFVGGSFLNAGIPAKHLAKWNGTSWAAVLGGANDTVHTLATVDEGSPNGPALWIGGYFTTLGGKGSSCVARLACKCPAPQSYCTAGTSSNGCAPAMSASGNASASFATPFVLSASGVDGQKAGLIFYGVSGATAAPWGTTSSFLCVKAPTQRTGQANSGGTAGACDGALVLDWNAYMSSHPNALGQPFQAGDHAWIQGWYRDPAIVKTTALTDALEVVICP